MKKRLVLPFIVLLLLLAGCGPGKDYTIDNVEVQARILPDGDLIVQELFTYTFKGSWNGATRYIDTAGHPEIEYFEAYIPPATGKFADFTYDNLNRLTVKLDQDNDTYYAYTASEDERKRVYYRYRVKAAAVRYTDRGELDWRFLTHNQKDLGNVTIDILLPGSGNSDSERVDYELQDSEGGGEVVMLKPDASSGSPLTLHYANERLAADGTAHMRISFPEGRLGDAPVYDGTGVPQEVEDEKAAQEREARETARAERDAVLAPAEKAARLLSLGFAVLLVLRILSPRRMMAFMRRGELPPSILETMDPLLAAYIYRRGRLKKRDLFAGVFSLRQRGLAVMEEGTAPVRFRQDDKGPDRLPKFIFQGQRRFLNKVDLFLVKRLFRSYGKQFSPETIAGPTPKERKAGKDRRSYRQKALQLDKDFKEWAALLSGEKPFQEYVRPNPHLRWIWGSLSLLHLLFVLYLLAAEGAGVWGYGVAAILLTAGGFLSVIYSRKTWPLLLSLLGCLLTVAGLADTRAATAYIYLLFLTIVLVPLVPRYLLSTEGMRYRSALKLWRRRLGQGEVSGGAAGSVADTEAFVRWGEFALTLDAGQRYLAAVQRRWPGSAEAAAGHLVMLEGLVYTQRLVDYVTPELSSSGSSYDGGGSSGGSSGGGDGGGTGAF
ncbi:DUF2207 domain-containing protein [Paenibacillus albidus]|uniref:DUF2207 domain-containing protein n=1 Tax=Paenibacillus albidus TaxID=2041023 RepID=UPI001BEC578D|nr:DUF2207 domain-containing protein [Paenibacillus albidus]MBT2293644.1 DUF2207 domain-containing protein [Paenibacillus albidus]